MSLKSVWERNVFQYRNDTLFEHRFASCTGRELSAWKKALYNNEIIFMGTDERFRVPDFSKMDFSGPETDHIEWVAQINRFRWITFASAEYAGTGSDHMAGLVYDSINAWMEYWPYYGDRTDIYPFRQHELWEPMMSTPIRLGFNKGCGWVGCLPLFFGHHLFTDEFIERVYESILWQLKPMVYNNREKGGENNWRPNELDCLLFVSSVLPDAREYLEYAVENINDTFEAQFEADGSHIEHTYDYHNWMTEIFTRIYFLSRNRPNLGLNIDSVKLIKAIDYSLDACAPDGRSFGIHDSWPWHPDNSDGDPEILKMRKMIAEDEGLPSVEESREGHKDAYYPDAGHFFFRNNWSSNGTMFFFDASRWGSWHCHLSRNSVSMYHGGRMLLIDPGSLDYGKSAIRNYGKFSTSHNTVTINGLSQCIYANPEILEYSLNEEIALVVSSYQGGYQDHENNSRPVPAEHERVFIWVRNKFAIVFDSINIYNNRNKNHIACHWQLPEGQVCHNENDLSANTLFDDSNVYIKCIYSEPMAGSFIHQGEKDPLLGYVSKTGGKLSGAKPAPMFSSETTNDAEFTRFCHLIVPYGGTGLPNVTVRHEKSMYAMNFTVEMEGKSYDVTSHYFKREYFKTNSAIRRIGNVDTFARAFVRETCNGKKIFEWEYRGK